MNVLLKKVRIVDRHSPYHLDRKDILICGGTIDTVADDISAHSDTLVISSADLHVSIGWVDMNASFGEPGLEYKEDIASGLDTALAGGFTKVLVMPRVLSVIDSKSSIGYLLDKSADSVVDILPVGAITKQLLGQEMGEMYDMHTAGAVAFSEGNAAIVSTQILEKALLYTKSFDGLILLHPLDEAWSLDAVMHEGIVSTRLGLKGMPSISETIALSKAIMLAKYTDARIHVFNISTKESIVLIEQAKKDGVDITASVNAYNLFLTDARLVDYDTNYKVNPPLRSSQDVSAIISGVKEGIIDVISSGHIPQDVETKKVEFDYASFGMIGLQTAYSLTNKVLKNQEEIVSCFVEKPRKILKLPFPSIKKGSFAELTVFDPSLTWRYDKHLNKSKSENSPFIGDILEGTVLGVINGNKYYWADAKG